MSLQVDDLATELLHIIISKLDPSTLRNCRLVKRRWRDICNEYFLSTIRTNTITKISRLMDFAQNDVIAGHVRSIRFAKKESDEWPDQSIASEVQNPASLGQEITISYLTHALKRLHSLAVSDGRPFPTMDRRRDWSSEATTEQLENLQPALSNVSVQLSDLCVEWLHTRFFLSKSVEIGQVWSSLTTLRLGLLCDGEMKGVRDLRLILRELSGLRQLHLSTPENMNLPLYCLIDERRVDWPHLASLTLRGFVARERILQRLFNLPSLRSISIARIVLDDDDDGCWARLMTALRKRKCGEVHISGWLANSTTDEGWYGSSDEHGSLFQELAEWLKRDDREAGNGGGCPLTIGNVNLSPS
jgi:hypothetical protein